MHLLVGGPAEAGIVFLACEAEKKLELLLMHLNLGPGAQVFFGHKWRNWCTAPLWLHYIDGYSCAVLENKFFFISGLGFGLKTFSYFSVIETFEIGLQKKFDRDWDLFGIFNGICLVSSTSYLHGLKSIGIAHLLCFFADIKFRLLVWVVFLCVLNVPVLFSQRISKYRLTSFSNFTSHVCALSILAFAHFDR